MAWISTEASAPSDSREIFSMLAPSAASVEAMAWMWRAPSAGRDGGDDVALGPGRGLAVAPRRSPRHRLEVQLHAQLLGGEQQLLEHVARARQIDQQAQGQLPLHHHLLDVGAATAPFSTRMPVRVAVTPGRSGPVTVTRMRSWRAAVGVSTRGVY